MRQSIINSIFSLIISFIITVIYWLVRQNFSDNSILEPLKIFGVNAFVLLIPLNLSFLSNRFSTESRNALFNDTIVPIYGLIVISTIGYLSQVFNFNISILICLIGYLFVFRTCLLFLNEISLKIKVIVLLIGGFFSIWVGSVCWFMVLKPFIVEGWAYGTDKIDTLYHISLAQMIKTYGIPTTGLDGVPFMKYHWASHWLFAQLSKFLDISVIKVYEIVFPSLIAPLLFRSFLSFISQVKFYFNPVKANQPNLLFWFLFLGIFIGFFTNWMSGNEWARFSTGGTGYALFMLLSESYAVSIILMFSILSSCLHFWKNIDNMPKYIRLFFLLVFLPVSIGILGFCKVSTCFVVCGMLFYFFVRLKLFNPVFFFSLLLSAMSAFFVLWIGFDTNDNTGNWAPLYFFNRFSVSIPFFLFLFFIWTHVFVFYYFFEKRLYKTTFFELIRDKNSMPMEFALWTALFGLLPVLFLKIDNYDSLYFLEIQMWISASLFLAFVRNLDFFEHRILKKVVLPLAFAISLFVFTYNTKVYLQLFLGDCVNVSRFVKGNDQTVDGHFVSIIKELPSLFGRDILEIENNYNNNKILSFFQKLKELDGLPNQEKKRTLIYVDLRTLLKDKSYNWNLGCHNIPFIVPSISGLAMIDGVDITYFDCVGGGCCEKIGLGYSYYQKWKTKQQIFSVDYAVMFNRVKKLGFENLIIYNIESEAFERFSL